MRILIICLSLLVLCVSPCFSQGFPHTNILDTFDGTGALSGNWTNIYNSISRDSDEAKGDTVDDFNDAEWNISTFTDCEVYVTINTKPENAYFVIVLARFDFSTYDGYALAMTENSGGTDTLEIRRYDSLTPTTLGSAINQEISVGDSIGLGIVGTTIKAYYRASGGSWVQIGSTQTDATHSSGYLGLDITSTTARVDNFGGGAYIPVPPQVVSKEEQEYRDALCHLKSQNNLAKCFLCCEDEKGCYVDGCELPNLSAYQWLWTPDWDKPLEPQSYVYDAGSTRIAWNVRQ